MTLIVIKWKSDFNDFKVSFSVSNSESILTCGWKSKASPLHRRGWGMYTSAVCGVEGNSLGLMEIPLWDKPPRFWGGHSRTLSLSYPSL